MSTRNRCKCGERHRRFALNGAMVTGCPKCLLREGKGRKYIEALIAASKALKRSPVPSAPQTQEETPSA